MDERFKAVNESLEALKSRHDLEREVITLQAKIRELESKLATR
ncbi:MAG: hypothetical protein QXW32_03160 [Nitrososphaerales archaeon]